ncbi:MAG: T9SS type A sorting domain-containing protein [Bacteroidia bacterium]
MKGYFFQRSFLLLFILFVSNTLIEAQVINIPDARFKAVLLAQGFDANNDGEIQVVEAQAIDSIHIREQRIKSFQGIESFVNLTVFDCKHSYLNVLDLSNNLALKVIRCDSSTMASVNMSGLTDLEVLSLWDSDISNLDISTNINLQHLAVGVLVPNARAFMMSAGFPNLNLTNNTLLENIQLASGAFSGTIDVSNRTHLKHLYIDTWANNVSVNASNCINLEYVTAIGHYGMNSLAGVNVANCTNLKRLDAGCSYMASIFNLDISNTPALEELICSVNELTSIDVSANTNLKRLTLSTSTITNLDISNNSLLEYLNIGGAFTSIDITNKPHLDSLLCSNTVITHLDISVVPNLKFLECGSSSVSNLVVSNNPNLLGFSFYGSFLGGIPPNISQNTQLNYIAFIGTYSNPQLNLALYPHLQTLKLISCGISQMPNISNNPRLKSLDLTYCLLSGNISLSNADSLEMLNLRSNGIQSLIINNCPQLKTLYADGTNLSSCYLSNLANLKVLSLFNNSLSSIDLSTIPQIEEVNLRNNLLNNLNVSNLLQLKALNVGGNNLSNIDVTNNTLLTSLITDFNPSMSALTLTQNPLLKFLATSSNFNTGTNGALIGLYVNGSNVTQLDVSPYPYLKSLYLYQTNIANIDISNNMLINSCSLENLPNTNTINFGECCVNQLFISTCPAITSLNFNAYHGYITKCNNLSYMKIKNNYAEKYLKLSNLPNLTDICADANEVSFVQTAASASGAISIVNVNSNCVSTSIPAATLKRFNIYPNPTNDKLTIKDLTQPATIYMYSLEGKLVYSQTYQATPSGITLELSQIAKGIYLLQIQTDSELVQQKVVVE